MPKGFVYIFLFAFLSVGLYSQRPTMELTFTAVDSAVYVHLDSIKVMNRTQGGDTVLYWPDTVLSIYYVGIDENPWEESAFQVFQNYPNPVADRTTVSMYVPENDKVSITVSDILGRIIVKSERVLNKGKHSFLFTPGGRNLYFFSALWRGNSSSIKILQTGFNNRGEGSLEYAGIEAFSRQPKAIKDIQDFSFSPGDDLLCIGYADTLQSGIPDAPEESRTYTFQYATNIPCPGTPTVEYEGQVYNTIQIYSQCWLKENLNAGGMIPGTIEQTNNGTIEKYCYENQPDSCARYGGLYQWNEMMQYLTQQGARGICPTGWHLPTDEEWKVLEGSVDSQYGIGDPEWDSPPGSFRGYDAGENLKTTTGWNYYGGNGTDLFGFSGLPGGGWRYWNGNFYHVGYYGLYWTSTGHDDDYALGHLLSFGDMNVKRGIDNKGNGSSVRCLRDD